MTTCWECEECGGVYREALNKHIIDYHNDVNDCPYCNCKRPLKGFNTLKTMNPEWFSEWSYLNNYLICDPDEILPDSNDNVWWHCNKCQYDYYMSHKNRNLFY